MNTDGVSVIIPNWNGAHRLRKLFQTLSEQRPVHEVILVDNGSTDSSVELARDAGARVINFTTNRGFAAAVNRGVAEAAAQWLAIINNDVELGPGWLETLLSAATANSVAFATGKLLNTARPDLIDGTYDAVSRGGTAWRCGAGRPDGPMFNREVSIQFSPFTAVLVQKQLFTRVGPLDEQFESYLEDIDFGFRCAKLGARGLYVPQAVAYHQGSATLGRWHAETVRRMARNQLLLVAKHYPHPWIVRYGWSILVAQGVWGLLAIRHGAAGPWLRGIGQGLRLFRNARSPGPAGIAAVLAESESQIFSSPDRYWRIYFALTGGW